MANRLKRNLALAGISSRCYTVDDMELAEQFKQTTKYKKWKESKDKEVKNLSRKVGRKKSPSEISLGLNLTRYLDLLLKHFQQ